MMHAIYNMLSAHKEAYQLIKQHNPHDQIGIAKNMICFQPYSRFSLFDRLLNRFIDGLFNQMLFETFARNRLNINLPFLLSFDKKIELMDSIDFWGVNYYYRMFVKWKLKMNKPFELKFEDRDNNGLSDLGWEIYPAGFYKMIKRAAASGKNI